jgi:dTDP-L-rhamnose 4-epimerase
VTGGAGFIGSHIVDRLVARGDEVVVVDDLDPAAHDGPPDGLSSRARYVWRDVRDPDTWSDALAGVDAVCHQAAKVGLGADFADVGEYVSRNDAGTACLLRALHDHGFRGRVVLASSMVVYGEGRYQCARHGVVRPGPRRVEDLDSGRYEPPCPSCGGPLEPEPVPEDHWLDPRNVYAVTKLSQELLGAAYAREHPDVTFTSLRYHNVYGPRMPRDTPYAGVASIFRSAYAAGRGPRVFEDGGQRRDFVHVTDVARANLRATSVVMNGAVQGGTCRAYNIASGEPHTVRDMACALADAFGGPEPVVTGDFRPGDVRHIVASPSRAAVELAFVASVPFAEGMLAFAKDPLRV